MTAVLELTAISKDYRGLRPLRIEQLTVAPGEQLAIVGIDQPSAEVLINLITGASLPDQGEVRAFGCSTASIGDSSEWLTLVDRFGMVSERAVLLDALSITQNLAIPFSLDVEPPPDDVRERAEQLAREVGLEMNLWKEAVGTINGAARVRVRLARALALDPQVLLLEHPTAGVASGDRSRLGRDVRAIAEGRGVATLTLTADVEFARTAAARVLMFDPARGRLTRRRGWGLL